MHKNRLHDNCKCQPFRNRALLIPSFCFRKLKYSLLINPLLIRLTSFNTNNLLNTNLNCSSGNYYGGWCSQYADTKQFLQIDLGQVTKITRIAHQGRSDAGWWTKTYSLSYSNDGARFSSYKNDEVNDSGLTRKNIIS